MNYTTPFGKLMATMAMLTIIQERYKISKVKLDEIMREAVENLEMAAKTEKGRQELIDATNGDAKEWLESTHQ